MVISADVAHSADPQQQKALIDCRLRGIRLFDEVSFSEQHLGRVNLECIGASWFLQSDGFWVGYLSCAVKRAIDIIASLVLLILTLPLHAGNLYPYSPRNAWPRPVSARARVTARQDIHPL